jgi:hypothetical protein
MITLVAQNHDIRKVNGTLPFHNATLMRLSPGSGVAFDEIDLFHQNAFFFGKDRDHPPALALVLARDQHHYVILFYGWPLLIHS